METADARRLEANALFKAGRVAEARDAFGSALAALAPTEAVAASSSPQAAAAAAERVRLLCNRAACHLQLKSYDKAVEDTTDAIAAAPGTVKAHFRRAQAFRGLGKPMRAVVDLQQVIRDEPDNAAATRMLAELLAESKREAAKPMPAVRAVDDMVAALSAAAASSSAAPSEPSVLQPPPRAEAADVARSKPPGVAPAHDLDTLVGHMARGLRGPAGGAAATALASSDGPVRVAAALEGAGVLAPVALLSAMVQVGRRGGADGVSCLARAMARHPGAFWPADARPGASAGRWSSTEVPDEAARLMALAEVAAAAQEPRLRALALASGLGQGSRAGAGARAAVSGVVDALRAEARAADIREVTGAALSACALVLGRSVGERAGPRTVTMRADGPGGVREAERLGSVEAAVHCVGRLVRTRSAADAAASLGLSRRLASVAAGAPPRLRKAAEGALTRVLERLMQPPDALPAAAEAAAGRGTAVSDADVAAVMAELGEWQRRRRLHRDPGRLAAVLGPVLGDVVDAAAERRRDELEQQARADEKASSRRAMKGLAAKRRKEADEKEAAAAGGEEGTAAAAASSSSGAAASGGDDGVVDAAAAEAAAAEREAADRARARAGEEAAAAAHGRSRPIADRHRAAIGLVAAFLVDRDSALAACRWRGVLPAVLSLAREASTPAQAACADVLAHLAADADGRDAIGEEGWASLRSLADLGSSSVRSSALVTLARSMASAKSTAASASLGAAPGTPAADPAAAAAMGLSPREEGAGPTAEELGLLESFVASARSLVLAVGPGADVWAARASGGAAGKPMSLGGGPGSAPDGSAAQTVTLAADDSGAFAITVRSPPEDDVPDAYSSLPGEDARRAEAAAALAAASGGVAASRPAPVIIASASRSIEALAVLCTRTVVKRALAADAVALEALMAVAGALGAEGYAAYKGGGGIVSAEWGPTALGVCFIIYALSVSEQERRERALAEREVTPQQWAEFQRLTMGGGGEDPERDAAEDVDARMRSLLRAGALGALNRIADAASLSWRAARAAMTGGAAGDGDGPSMGGGDGAWVVSSSRGARGTGPGASSAWRGLSEADRMRAEEDERRRPAAASGTLQFVSSAAQCLSGRVWARRLLAGGGGVRLLLRLADESSGNTMSGRTLAAHALAQVLVSTNPALLTDAQRADVVGPLLLLTHSPSGLQCFEAALALTNVGSHGTDEAMRIVSSGGLSALEDVQFCDNVRLRRAGTEAIANLATTPKGAGHITGERLPLWLALARSYGDDLETATAAAGGIAMALAMDDGDPMGDDDPSAGGRARLLAHPRGVSSLCCAVASGNQPLQHRAIAALQMLAGTTTPAPVPADAAAASGSAAGVAPAVLRGWEELARPRELGNPADDDEEEVEGRAEEEEAEEDDDDEAMPGLVKRRAAGAVAAAATASAPPAVGVEVSAMHLCMLLAQGRAMPDLTADEGEDGAAVAPAELSPQVQSAAEQLLRDVRAAAERDGVELAF